MIKGSNHIRIAQNKQRRKRVQNKAQETHPLIDSSGFSLNTKQ